LTGGDELWNALDFYETDAAGGGDGKARVIAVTREDVAGVETGLENHLAIFAVDEFSVDGDRGHRAGDGIRKLGEIHQGLLPVF